MANENKSSSGKMVFHLHCGTSSESGKVYVKGEIFLEDPITRLDLVQEWIASLEKVLDIASKGKEATA